MKKTSIVLAAAVAAVLVIVPSTVQGQAKGKGKGDGKANPAVVHKPIPRASDGKPDLTGTWQAGEIGRAHV